MYDPYLESIFPLLSKSGYKITSPFAPNYNCIAWAAGKQDAWWEPDPFRQYYWPHGVPREYTLDAYIKVYKFIGYKKCSSENFEEGFEKIAIFVNSSNIPTHTARQLKEGKWTSKLGKNKDIEHALQGLTKSLYGEVAVIMIRKKGND